MNILQLCHKPPFPAKDGGCIAMNNITNGLIQAGHQVKLLTIETHKHPLEIEQLPKSYRTNTGIEAIYVDTKVNIVDAFSNLITQDSYNISRFFSPDFDMKLIEVLKHGSFDIIHMESLFMTPYIATARRFSDAKIVLRSHNLEFLIWERMAKASKNRAKRTYLAYLARQLKKYELSILGQVDGVAAISGEDAQKYCNFEGKTPIITIPFGIDVKDYSVQPEKTEYPTLFHLGSMDWMPNIEGIQWFLDKVWPKVHQQQPQLKLYLAGRNMPDWLAEQNHPNVVIVGEVDSAIDFMHSKSVMLVPLLSAGGIRVKIIEGMALGKTIISTRVGAEGIGYENLKNIMIADNPDEFAVMIHKATTNQEACEQIGINARALAEEQYDNQVLTENLVRFYEKLMA